HAAAAMATTEVDFFIALSRSGRPPDAVGVTTPARTSLPARIARGHRPSRGSSRTASRHYRLVFVAVICSTQSTERSARSARTRRFAAQGTRREQAVYLRRPLLPADDRRTDVIERDCNWPEDGRALRADEDPSATWR